MGKSSTAGRLTRMMQQDWPHLSPQEQRALARRLLRDHCADLAALLNSGLSVRQCWQAYQDGALVPKDMTVGPYAFKAVLLQELQYRNGAWSVK